MGGRAVGRMVETVGILVVVVVVETVEILLVVAETEAEVVEFNCYIVRLNFL